MNQLQYYQIESNQVFLNNLETLSSPMQSTNVSPSSRTSNKDLLLIEDFGAHQDQPSPIRPQKTDLRSQDLWISTEFWSQNLNEKFRKSSHEKVTLPSLCQAHSKIKVMEPFNSFKEISIKEVASVTFRQELEALNSINLGPKMRLVDNFGGLSEQTSNKITREKWGPVKDQTLLKLAVELNEDWPLIAQRLSRFKVSAEVLRDHYEKLQTQVLPEKRRFTGDEDTQILKCYKKFGPKWKLIANKLYRRTAASVKSRFYSNLRYRIEKMLSPTEANSNADLAEVVLVSSDSEAEENPESWTDIDHFLYSDKKNSSQRGCDLRLESEEQLFLEGGDDEEGYEVKKKLKSETSSSSSSKFNFEDITFFAERKLDFNDQCLSYDENLIAKLIPSETEGQNKITHENEQKNSHQSVIEELHIRANSLVSSLISIYDQIQIELDKSKRTI